MHFQRRMGLGRAIVRPRVPVHVHVAGQRVGRRERQVKHGGKGEADDGGFHGVPKLSREVIRETTARINTSHPNPQRTQGSPSWFHSCNSGFPSCSAVSACSSPAASSTWPCSSGTTRTTASCPTRTRYGPPCARVMLRRACTSCRTANPRT